MIWMKSPFGIAVPESCCRVRFCSASQDYVAGAGACNWGIWSCMDCGLDSGEDRFCLWQARVAQLGGTRQNRFGRISKTILVRQLLSLSFIGLRAHLNGSRSSENQFLGPPALRIAILHRLLNTSMSLKPSGSTGSIAWGHLRLHCSMFGTMIRTRAGFLSIGVGFWQALTEAGLVLLHAGSRSSLC